MKEKAKEKWNENVETCKGCGIEWKKIGIRCPVCYTCHEGDKAKQNEEKK